MRKLMTICATLGALAGLAMADSWTGTVMDAHCANRTTPCMAKRTTARFVIDVNGKKYRLDAKSNYNMRSALREDKHFHKGEPVTATISGQMSSNGRIHAHTIAVQ